LLDGSDHLGWHPPWGLVHHAENEVRHAVGPVGGVLAWLLNAGVSAVIGLIVGFVGVALVALLSLVRRGR
jgi:predicted DNA repair protein MutK